jgi:hypothetical protein
MYSGIRHRTLPFGFKLSFVERNFCAVSHTFTDNLNMCKCRDDQWVKCDDCGCWRRLPADTFVPATWICSDNEWDLRRLVPVKMC